MREISLKEISLRLSLKPRELLILLPLGSFLIIFLKFFLGIRGLIQVSFFALILIYLFLMGAEKWRLSLYFFFSWLLLEGIFRKWIAPGFSTPIFFVKHLVLVGPYLYLLSGGFKVAKRDYPFFGLLLSYLVCGVLEAVNFRATTDFRVQVLGLINHFWFMPLIFLVPQLLNTTEKIIRFFKIIAYISLPIFIFGVIQYFSPISSPLNKYVSEDASIAGVGIYTRITGVFSYITTYTSYLEFYLMVALYLILVEKMSRFMKSILYITALLGIINLIMTGSRGPVVFFVLEALLFLILSFKPNLQRWRKTFVSFALFSAVLLCVVFLTDIGKTSSSTLRERTQNNEDITSRLISAYTPFRFLPSAGIGGYGIGTTYQGIVTYVEDWGDMPRNFETEWGRILLELGLIGFIIVLLFRFYVFFYSWKVFKKIKSYELKLIALLIFVLQMPAVTGLSGLVFNYIENVTYWFLIGLLVSVNRLGRNDTTKGFGISSK